MYIKKCVCVANNLQVRFVSSDVSRLLFMLVTRFDLPNLLVNKLDYSRALVCDFVHVSNDTRATHELHAKINGNHTSMVHVSVKLKLSCTILSLRGFRSTQIHTASVSLGMITIAAHQGVDSSTGEMTPKLCICCNSDISWRT